MKTPIVFTLFLMTLCFQALQAKKCSLIKALEEQYSQYQMGYLEYEVKRFTSYDVDTSVQRVHLSFAALPDRTPTESKDFTIHMHFPLGQHRRIQDGDSLYYIHEVEQLMKAKPVSPGNELQYRLRKLPVIENGFFFNNLHSQRIDCAEEDETHWYLRSNKRNLAYRLKVRKADSLITEIQFQSQGGEHHIFESVRITRQQYGSAALQLDYDASDWREKAYRSPKEQTQEESEEAHFLIGQSAPNWNGVDHRGDSLSLADLRGKYVLLDFWYIGCAPCVSAMPELEGLRQQYSEEDLVIVGIEVATSEAEKIAAFLTEKGVSYPNLVANGSELPNQYEIEGYPTYFLLDPEGKVVYQSVGYSAKKFAKLRRLLKQEIKQE